MNDKARLHQMILDTIVTDDAVREMARTVLSEKEVYGDGHGIPTIEDIIELLISKIPK